MTSTIARTGIDIAPIDQSALARTRTFGWPVRLAGSSVLLETTSGICAVEMRQDLGNAVMAALAEIGSDGPVIRVMRPVPWLVFLADADAVADNAFLRRYNASVITGGRTVPLPPSDHSTGPVSWALAPQPNHRWLPKLSTITWALTRAASAA